jgi:hypothetical protein
VLEELAAGTAAQKRCTWPALLTTATLLEQDDVSALLCSDRREKPLLQLVGSFCIASMDWEAVCC